MASAPNIQAMPRPATPIAAQVRAGSRSPRKMRAASAVSSGPVAIATSTLATLVRVSATMKAVYMVAQHRPENQITRRPARMSRNSAVPRSGSSTTSSVSVLNRLRQKVTSKLRAASRWRVTTPAMLHSSVASTISATAWRWLMGASNCECGMEHSFALKAIRRPLTASVEWIYRFTAHGPFRVRSHQGWKCPPFPPLPPSPHPVPGRRQSSQHRRFRPVILAGAAAAFMALWCALLFLASSLIREPADCRA
jgi:hypothetical protein